MTEENRQMARVQVSKDLLISMLHFPCDVEVLTIRIADDPRNVEMVVRHPGLPPVTDSGLIPLASPQITEHFVTFDGWGL